MSDYTQITLFTPKDALTTGNPLKKIKGADIDPEFSAIASAVQTKFDSDDVASNSDAAALSSDAKVMTAAKVGHALQNASITLGANVLLNGGIAASDVARKGTSNTFTATQVITGTNPRLRFIETGVAANQGNWRLDFDASQMTWSAVSDDDNSINTFITATRSSFTVPTLIFGATAVRVGSFDIWHAGNINLAAGNYTPSATAVTNCSISENGRHQYHRVGNTVTVSGRTRVNVSATGITQFTLNLPIALVNNFSSNDLANGAGASDASAAATAAFVRADTSGSANRLFVEFVAAATGLQYIRYACQYEIV